ncbi:unnamed protein product [Urochloa humidicola]
MDDALKFGAWHLIRKALRCLNLSDHSPVPLLVPELQICGKWIIQLRTKSMQVKHHGFGFHKLITSTHIHEL